ncbi:MAG: SLC13 family permease [Deltaproteobacteria bacterium]|nr:SLC13 family permease [Deltaproteobacteria bacterium]
MSKKQIIGSCLGVILGITIAFITPPEGLTPQAMHGLGILLWAVTCWVFEVAPDYVIAIAMCTLWVLFQCVQFKTAFATFSDTTWWLLIGAMGMGVAVSKSGLLKRISLRVMQIFPTTFNGQVLALISAGTMIAPLIPSMTAKAAIAAPISMGISDAMGYQRKGRGAAGLYGAMYLGFVLTGPMFVSASFIGYMMRGLLPQNIQDQFNWTMWFTASIAWSAVVLVLTYIAIIFLYTPKEKDSLLPDHAAKLLVALGPMQRNEKITAIVLMAALLCWMTERLHGINATVIALVGLVVLLACRVFDRQDFRSGIGWDNMIFIGMIINLGSVLPALKIDKWIAQTAGPMIEPMISNIYLFIVVLSFAIYAIRFVLVSFTATTAIFTVMLVPFALQAGINPWVTGFIVYASTNIWFIFYQNSTFLTCYYAVEGEMVTHRQMVPLSFAYCAISIVAFLLSVPLWQYLGLVP